MSAVLIHLVCFPNYYCAYVIMSLTSFQQHILSHVEPLNAECVSKMFFKLSWKTVGCDFNINRKKNVLQHFTICQVTKKETKCNKNTFFIDVNLK